MVEKKARHSLPIGRESELPPFRRLTGWTWNFLTGRAGLFWQVVGLFCLFGLLWLGMYLAGGDSIFDKSDYQITHEKIVLIPKQPEWIQRDIPKEVFLSSGLNGSILLTDDTLIEQVRGAFSLSPWIKKIIRVTKEHPARVRIDVEYRRPVLMVDTSTGLVPVDGEAVTLPAENFRPRDQLKYPRLLHVKTPPTGLAGDPWLDPRVVQAARIIGVLGDYITPWEITQIAPSPTPLEGTRDHYHFTLVTNSGTEIPWGLAPTLEQPRERTALEKIEWLKNEVETHGGLGASPRLRSKDFHF